MPSETSDDNGLAALPDRLTQVFAAIRARAPKARIVLVEYVRVVAASASCPDRAPVSPTDRARVFSTHARLTQAMAGAVRANGVDVLPAAALSVGHEVCSARPWMFDYSPTPAVNPTSPTTSITRAAALWGRSPSRSTAC